MSKKTGAPSTVGSDEFIEHASTKEQSLANAPLPEVEENAQPNKWWRYRQSLREYAAEFAGVMMIIIFGDGVVCQVVLSSNPDVTTPKGEYLSISFGWAIGVAVGVWIAAGISGAHLNPAVTLSLAIFRGFSWKKVPGYCFAQLMGGLVGAAIIYANYIHAIDIFEGGREIRTLKTAGLFSTYALDYMTTVSCFFSEFMASAVLLIAVFAFIDKKNHAAPPGLLPLPLFILILGIGACLGMQTGYAINPARDLGPRILTSMVGYGTAVYSFRNQYWLWCPVIAPICGSVFGAFLYDLFLYDGDDNQIRKWVHKKYGHFLPPLLRHSKLIASLSSLRQAPGSQRTVANAV